MLSPPQAQLHLAQERLAGFGASIDRAAHEWHAVYPPAPAGPEQEAAAQLGAKESSRDGTPTSSRGASPVPSQCSGSEEVLDMGCDSDSDAAKQTVEGQEDSEQEAEVADGARNASAGSKGSSAEVVNQVRNVRLLIIGLRAGM